MPSFQNINLDATGSVVGGDGKWRSNDLQANAGALNVAWDLPNQYTDNSKLFPKTYIVKYGTNSGGPYTNAVDMSLDDDPAMLRKTITGTSSGVTYYCVVQSVDSEGFVSAESSEVAIVSAVPSVAADPVVYTEIRQVDLPYTINASGDYRIMENLTYDVNDSPGILITASDVKLFAASADSIVYTVCNLNDSIGVELSGALSTIEIFGFHITVGTRVYSSAINHGHIYASNAGNSIDGLVVRSMEFTTGQPNQNQLNGTGTSGGVILRSPNGIGYIVEAYNNTFNIRGTGYGSISGISVGTGGTSRSVIVHDNIFNCSDASGTSAGYQRPVNNADEAYGNTFNITSCSFTAYGMVGLGNTPYTHGNTFNVTASNSVRCIIDAENTTARVHLYNTLNVISTAGVSGEVRLYRCRFGANDCIYGYSTMDGNNQLLSSTLFDVYGTQPEYGDTRNNYVYHNTVTNTNKGIIHVLEQAENTYLWGNNADTTNVYGAFLRSAASGENANGLYFDGDSIAGSTADVLLLTDGAWAAVENAHFAGLGAISISNNAPANTVAETHYWVDGNAGLVTHTNRNTGTKTPKVPTNVRAA